MADGFFLAGILSIQQVIVYCFPRTSYSSGLFYWFSFGFDGYFFSTQEILNGCRPAISTLSVVVVQCVDHIRVVVGSEAA